MLTNLQPVQRDRIRIVADPDSERAQLLPGRDGAANVERQRYLVRPFGVRPGHGTHEGGGRVEVEPLRLQFRIHPCAAVGTAMDDRHAPFERAAVDLGLHGIDGKSARRERDVAAQAEGFLAARGDVAAPLQPGRQHVRIGGFRIQRGLEAVGRRARRTRTAQRHPRRAGGAEFQPTHRPDARVAVQFGADVL